MKHSSPYLWDYINPKTYNNKIGEYKFQKEFYFILKNIQSCNEKVLDIAGGSGRIAIPLQEYSTNITVIDHNENAIKLLNERSKNIRGIFDDFLEMKIDEKYSSVLCIEALGYMNNLHEFFDKIYYILENEGKFIFTCNNPQSWRYIFNRMKHSDKKSFVYNEIRFNELQTIISKCKFKIDCVEGMNWIPFAKSSNNILIPLFIFLERFFRLNKWINQSPWLLISIKKK